MTLRLKKTTKEMLKKRLKMKPKKICILAKETSECCTHLVDSQTLNFNSCKIADNIAHCLSQSREIHKAYTKVKKKPSPTMITQDPFKEPLKGLFLDGVLITGEGWTAHFRPEVDNGCQVTSIHPSLVQKYNL